jgi:hypothetical protein
MPRRKKTDPELLVQLEQAQKANLPVQAVFQLTSSARKAPPPAEIATLAEEVLSRAMATSGTVATRTNVFRNIGAMAVEAPVAFIEALIEDPAVTRATANKQPGSMRIPPAER